MQRVLQGLLDEHVGIRDLVRIFEALSLRARETKDPEHLIEVARGALGAAIVQPYISDGGVHVISFEPQLEQRMLEALRPTDEGSVVAFDMETGQVVLMRARPADDRGGEPQRHARSSSAPPAARRRTPDGAAVPRADAGAVLP